MSARGFDRHFQRGYQKHPKTRCTPAPDMKLSGFRRVLKRASAKRELTTDLTETDAVAISRDTWGHTGNHLTKGNMLLMTLH